MHRGAWGERRRAPGRHLDDVDLGGAAPHPRGERVVGGHVAAADLLRHLQVSAGAEVWTWGQGMRVSVVCWKVSGYGLFMWALQVVAGLHTPLARGDRCRITRGEGVEHLLHVS